MDRWKKFFLYCGILMLASEIWKQWSLTFLLGGGHYNWWHFPFQLCSIPMYICLLIGLPASKKYTPAFLSFLMDYGLVAGIFTFFDTTGLHYAYRPLTVHSYTWHLVLIILGICAGLTRRADYTSSGYKKSTGIYLACAFIATLCNLAFYPYGDINMFYISPHYEMTQKVFGEIAGALGKGAGIFIYMLAIMSGAWLLHKLWAFLPKRTPYATDNAGSSRQAATPPEIPYP